MEDKYLCPKCNSDIEVIRGCGSEGYFCKSCNRLISSKEVIKVVENNQ